MTDTGSITQSPGASIPTNQGSAVATQSMSYGDVENAWIQAGGNPQAAAMAAAIADASSGFDPNITRTNPDGSVSVGLWLIPQSGQPPGSTDPVANARAAVQLSNNGTDWSQWCVAWSDNNCGQNQGTYLGQGANALGSLSGKLGLSSYNVIGSAPSGTGVGASAATAGTYGATPSSTSSHSFGLIAALVVIVLVVVFISRRSTPKVPVPEAPEGAEL